MSAPDVYSPMKRIFFPLACLAIAAFGAAGALVGSEDSGERLGIHTGGSPLVWFPVGIGLLVAWTLGYWLQSYKGKQPRRSFSERPQWPDE